MSGGSVQELDWLLHNLAATVGGVQNAVILSLTACPSPGRPG